MREEIIELFITKQIKKPLLCSVLLLNVKHLGRGRVLKKWGKTLDCVLCFPLLFFSALPLPACFTTEQSTIEASLFVKGTGYEARQTSKEQTKMPRFMLDRKVHGPA